MGIVINGFSRIGLRRKILFIIGALVIVTMIGGLASVWLATRIRSTLTSVIDVDVAALNVSEELESALAMQRGLLTYYLMDGNSEWLTQLDQHKYAFEQWLRRAREVSRTDRQLEILNEIESKYIRYSHARDQVLNLHKSGDAETGLNQLRAIRSPFYAIRDLCEQYKETHYKSIKQSRVDILSQAQLLTVSALTAVPATFLLGIALVFVLVRRILGPVRDLIERTKVGDTAAGGPDEIAALTARVDNLLEHFDSTQTQLQQSREHLLQSEKLALVGKLAAGVAHSIRNPLTSVKMRLFTMERTLKLSSNQKDDFEVISDEIRHIDNIVQNFLEFSRPPKLKMQSVSPSDVVDMAIQLLKHRVESYGVTLELYRRQRLPDIEGDPEQLKEVLVNLIVNACEATGDGGKILIREEEGVSDPIGPVAVIRVSDNGPGIPDSIVDTIFQPFFSTKEEGTGLGLSIAARIIEDHRGCLNVKSRKSKGTTFTITLPCKEDGAWLRS